MSKNLLNNPPVNINQAIHMILMCPTVHGGVYMSLGYPVLYSVYFNHCLSKSARDSSLFYMLLYSLSYVMRTGQRVKLWPSKSSCSHHYLHGYLGLHAILHWYHSMHSVPLM